MNVPANTSSSRAGLGLNLTRNLNLTRALNSGRDEIKSKSKIKSLGNGGFTLVEMMVYIAVLVVITAVGFSVLYRCMDASRGLKRNTTEIADALRAGEDWRADLRAASTVRVRNGDEGQVLNLASSRGEIGYRFATNAVFRRIGNNPWSPMLANVEASRFVSETRGGVVAWRWELELQSRSKKFTQVKPLFTFIAVPAGDAP